MLSEGNSSLIQEMHSVLSVYLCTLKVLEVLQDDFYVIKEVLGCHRGVKVLPEDPRSPYMALKGLFFFRCHIEDRQDFQRYQRFQMS